jgi:hypothetical protein
MKNAFFTFLLILLSTFSTIAQMNSLDVSDFTEISSMNILDMVDYFKAKGLIVRFSSKEMSDKKNDYKIFVCSPDMEREIPKIDNDFWKDSKSSAFYQFFTNYKKPFISIHYYSDGSSYKKEFHYYHCSKEHFLSLKNKVKLNTTFIRDSKKGNYDISGDGEIILEYFKSKSFPFSIYFYIADDNTWHGKYSINFYNHNNY